MPTIEELFRSKKLSSGKTAEEQYAVRNSKENELTSAVGLLGLPFKAATALRRKISTTGTETLVEQETTGLRVISKLSSPIIYGTKIARFTLQQSDDVAEMKSARVEQWQGIGAVTLTPVNGGLLGGLVNSVRNTISNVKSLLGVPQNIIPTKIYLNTSEFNSDSVNVSETMTKLAEIQKKGGGTAFGKLISKGFGTGGTLNQLGNNIAGATAQAGKNLLKSVLFGSGQGGQKNLATNAVTYPIYGSFNYRGHKKPLDKYYLFHSNTQQSNSKPGEKYSDIVRPDIETSDILKRNDLSSKYYSIEIDSRFREKTILLGRKGNKYTKYNKPKFDKYSLESKLGLTTNVTDENGNTKNKGVGNYTDALNELSTYKPDADGTKKDSEGNSYDEYDFVALKFYSITKEVTAQFRATITGLTETFAPTWDSNKFVGNPFNFYTYSGIERSVQFNFKVYSLSILEHKAAWERLNFLASLVYPTYAGFALYTVPPFLKFTLGNMYKNKECFIDSLIYTVDDNNMWEIGENYKSDTYADLKLPTIIDVGVTLKFVENKSNTNGVKLYGFGKDGTKGAPTQASTGNPVTGTGAPATPIVPTVPTITPVVIPDPPIVPTVVKKGKGLDGSIVKNPNRRTIEEITKESADAVLSKKLLGAPSIALQMQPPPNGGSSVVIIDVSTPASITTQDDSGKKYNAPDANIPTWTQISKTAFDVEYRVKKGRTMMSDDMIDKFNQFGFMSQLTEEKDSAGNKKYTAELYEYDNPVPWVVATGATKKEVERNLIKAWGSEHISLLERTPTNIFKTPSTISIKNFTGPNRQK
jgi:hypothetical protein